MKVLYQADNGLRKVTAGRFAGNRRAHNPHELDGVPDPEVLAFAAFRQRIEHKSDSDFRSTLRLMVNEQIEQREGVYSVRGTRILKETRQRN